MLRLLIIISFFLVLLTNPGYSGVLVPKTPAEPVDQQLGWIQTGENRCGGYYLEAPFLYSDDLLKNDLIKITSDQLLFAQHGTSVGQGRVTITRFGQEIVANKAYLYRDPVTGKLSAIELLDHVALRAPNDLIIANYGRFDLKTKAQSLHEILYRTAIYSNPKNKPALPPNDQLQKEHKIYQLSAWGRADSFSQDEPKIYNFNNVSYSTCPPLTNVWKVKASHLTLDKNTGRGSATHARILVKGIPVFYAPYFTFPIDSRRQTGFLWPAVGTSSKLGPYASLPFYWNMAPNYDMTITPAYLSKRGAQLADNFRYLTPKSVGEFDFAILPHDRAFEQLKVATAEQAIASPSLYDTPAQQSELRRLHNASLTRTALKWKNDTRFNEHWSDNIDFNWVSDDNYLIDLNSNLNQVTQNQLLQKADLNYKGQNWNFLGRVQAYQTLHPVTESTEFSNQYMRLPQLILSGNYPNNPGGFEYFVDNDVGNFKILPNPGNEQELPIGYRLHTQPGISRPFIWPFFTVTPRLQMALTKYEIRVINNIGIPNPTNPGRVLPIVDVNSILYFDRNLSLFNTAYRQTLEPQFYYTYIPYRNQNQLPVFDTIENTLTYDQLFIYNRFSGIDRINDANQLAVGLTTRFIEQQTGAERIKAAIGQIVYFQPRKVTLCETLVNPVCPPDNTNNHAMLSPLTGLLTYAVNPNWSLSSNTIWNSKTSQIDNESVGLHYQPPGTQKIINLGYNFARQGPPLPNNPPNNSASNLSTTDISFNWPVGRDWSTIGRWTQNWNRNYFQNMLYGLQYDSCCWAVRFVAGRIFTSLNANNTPQYNNQVYVQVALKGLGDVPITGGNPGPFLSSAIAGYQNTFGRDF